MKSKRTKACEISPEVRKEVEERDSINGIPRCIFCKSYQCRGEAHYIGRGQGGLGIPQNLITVCRNCHREMDNGLNTKRYREIAKEYLMSCYPDWNEKDLIYDKWRNV